MELFGETLPTATALFLILALLMAFGFEFVNPSFSTRWGGDPGSRSRSTSWSKGLYHRSDVLVLIQKLSARANARWRLGWQREMELFEQEFVIGLWMGVAA